SEEYLKTSRINLYRETDVITYENIDMIREKSDTKDNPIWSLIFDNLSKITQAISGLKEVITYNDFYWTNLIVRQDKSAALMFDFNLSGIGYRYSDIRNVCSSLSANSIKVFMDEYGNIDKNEKIVDDIVSPLVTLVFAFQRPVFPS